MKVLKPPHQVFKSFFGDQIWFLWFEVETFSLPPSFCLKCAYLASAILLIQFAAKELPLSLNSATWIMTATDSQVSFMWSHGINPWYQHDTQHWHVVCFIPALASYIFPGKGNKKANTLGLQWGCHSGNLSSLAMLRKICMNFVKSTSKKVAVLLRNPWWTQVQYRLGRIEPQRLICSLGSPPRVGITETNVASVDAVNTYYHISHLKSSLTKYNEATCFAYVCPVEALSSSSMAQYV